MRPLANPPPDYSADHQRSVQQAITEADAQNLKDGQPVLTLTVLNHDTGLPEEIKWTNAGWASA